MTIITLAQTIWQRMCKNKLHNLRKKNISKIKLFCNNSINYCVAKKNPITETIYTK